MPHARCGGRVAAVVLAMAAATAAGDEFAPFLRVHEQATSLASRSQWQQAAAAYATFAEKAPKDICAPLASTLQGILTLRELKKPDQARAAFLRATRVPDTPFGRQLADIARGWLARLAMKPLEAALRRYWVMCVEYPERLDGLVSKKLADPKALLDPWGKPYEYRTGRLRIAPDMPRQTYTLRCAALGDDSRGLHAALERTAELPGRFILKAVGGSQPLSALIETTGARGRAVQVAEGEAIEAARLIKLTRTTAVLADRGAVAILTR